MLKKIKYPNPNPNHSEPIKKYLNITDELNRTTKKVVVYRLRLRVFVCLPPFLVVLRVLRVRLPPRRLERRRRLPPVIEELPILDPTILDDADAGAGAADDDDESMLYIIYKQNNKIMCGNLLFCSTLFTQCKI